MRLWRDPSRDADVRTPFAQHPGTAADQCDVGRVTIDVLPDVALLEIFNCYVNQGQKKDDDSWRTRHMHVYICPEKKDSWHTLVHVCQKWRSIVFGSPRRLNLRLLYTGEASIRKMLAVWPPLPIIVRRSDRRSIDNIMAALEHNDRVCEISLLDTTRSELKKALVPMQQPYPALTDLKIWLDRFSVVAPIAPESFLGGSAPRLRHLSLEYIPFPGIPNLLLSATHLVVLHLWKIPNSGYFTPEAIVTGLSTSTRLEALRLGFESPLSHFTRESRRPPPLTRSVLPALTQFRFEGSSEYLEDLVARIDTPLLDDFGITFSHELTFDTPQLTQFISRTATLETQVEARAGVVFFGDYVRFSLVLPQGFPREFELGVTCTELDLQLSSLVQIISSAFPQTLIPTIGDLFFPRPEYSTLDWEDDDIEDSPWLRILHPFTKVKNLYLSLDFVALITRILYQLVGERVMEVLPALQSVFVDESEFILSKISGPIQEGIEKFVAARQLAGHPITVSPWGGIGG